MEVVNKIDKLVEELKNKFTQEVSDGEVYLNQLPQDPMNTMQGTTNYIVTMHSPTKGTDKYLVVYHKESGKGDFIRIFGG